jgi:hypothetical protein
MYCVRMGETYASMAAEWPRGGGKRDMREADVSSDGFGSPFVLCDLDETRRENVVEDSPG